MIMRRLRHEHGRESRTTDLGLAYRDESSCCMGQAVVDPRRLCRSSFVRIRLNKIPPHHLGSAEVDNRENTILNQRTGQTIG